MRVAPPKSAFRSSAGLLAAVMLISACSSDDKPAAKAAAEPSSKHSSGTVGSSASSDESSSDDDTPAADPLAADAAYKEAGPYTVGVTTLTIGDRKVEVWYPADSDATEGTTKESYSIKSWLSPTLQGILPADIDPLFETDAYRDITGSGDGPFPLVLFRHGHSGYRNQSTFLTTHLASWGMVVASPDQREIGLEFLGGVAGAPETPRDPSEVMRAAVNAVREQSNTDGVLQAMVADGKIGLVGHSAGGFASAQFATEPDVAVYIPLAAGIGGDGDEEAAAYTAPNVPSLHLLGDIDTVVIPEVSRAGFNRAAAPAYLVELKGSGHLNGFSDICMIGAEGGGIVQLAIDNGFPVPEQLTKLGTDGCQADAEPSTELWPITNHFVTAAMRHYLGIDETPVGLNEATAQSFTDVAVTYKERSS